MKPSQACFCPSQSILVADVREIPFIISHPNLYEYTHLSLCFTNWYDKIEAPINLAQTGPCPHDSNSFVDIRCDNIICKFVATFFRLSFRHLTLDILKLDILSLEVRHFAIMTFAFLNF